MPSDAVVEGVSGAIGGCVATIATYPLMTISTRQATRVHLRPSAPTAAQKDEVEGTRDQRTPPLDKPASPPAVPPSLHYKGTMHELSEAIRTSQWKSLFSGLPASLFGTTISQGVYFYLYSLLRQTAVRRRAAPGAGGDARSADITVAESLFVAALAGMGNVLLTNPIWMVATRMQTHQRQQASESSAATVSIDNNNNNNSHIAAPGPVSVARHIYAEYGISGFWNGVGASLVMVINPTIQYALYEWLSSARARVVAQRAGGKAVIRRRPSALEVFLLSAIAKAGATLLTYPLLTVKQRMMSARKTDADMQYTSVADAFVQIGQKEGPLGYFKGIQTKIVQSVLAGALLFMCKEKITDATRELLSSRDAQQKKNASKY